MTATRTGFGNRVRALRREAGISGRELARRSGVSESEVRHVEGGHEPGLDIASRLAAGLGLTVGQVLGGAGLDGVERR